MEPFYQHVLPVWPLIRNDIQCFIKGRQSVDIWVVQLVYCATTKAEQRKQSIQSVRFPTIKHSRAPQHSTSLNMENVTQS